MVVGIDNSVIFRLSKLSNAKFFLLYDIQCISGRRLKENIMADHSWEGKG